MQRSRLVLVTVALAMLTACAASNGQGPAANTSQASDSVAATTGVAEDRDLEVYEAWQIDWERRYELLEGNLQDALEIHRISLSVRQGRVSRRLAATSVQSLVNAIQDRYARLEQARATATPPPVADRRRATTIRTSEGFLRTFDAQARWISRRGMESFQGVMTGRSDAALQATADIVEGLATLLDAVVPVWRDAVENTAAEQPQYALYQSMIHSAPAMTEAMRRLGSFLLNPSSRPAAMSPNFFETLDVAADWVRTGRNQSDDILANLAEDRSLSPELSVVMQLFYETYPPSFDIEDQMIAHLRETGDRFETLDHRQAAEVFATLSTLLYAREKAMNRHQNHFRNIPPVLRRDLDITVV